jgi:hypothetical protein
MHQRIKLLSSTNNQVSSLYNDEHAVELQNNYKTTKDALIIESQVRKSIK